MGILYQKEFDDVSLVCIIDEISSVTPDLVKEAGFDAYIAQPILKTELVKILQRICSLSKDGSVMKCCVEENLLKGRKILAADDNAINLKLITVLLEKFGCIVSTAKDGQEVIDKVQKENFDAILLDIQMPVLGGLEAARILRNKTKLKIPILGLSTAVMRADVERALESGMDDFVAKPVTVIDLRQKLNKWLQSSI